jgi:hypothetical protein
VIEHALLAGLPLIVVKTDDLTTVREVLGAVSKRKVLDLPPKLTGQLPPAIFISSDQERITPDTYEWARKNERQVVFVNCESQNLAFDAGMLTPPDDMVWMLLSELQVAHHRREEVRSALKGLTLKVIREILLLTAVETGSIDNVPAIRRTRATLSGGHQGLYPLDTDIGYYDVPQVLSQYLALQGPYFKNPSVPAFLRPRGLMFSGVPGTGKTMAAKYIAKTWGVPLYRLDIASMLNRYLGESENRLMHIFSLLDREEPCVVLLDEVEKIFNKSDADNKAIDRLLAQALWWLQDHVTRVLTIMTTNDLSIIPEPLYRKGRIDDVITVPLLTVAEARNLSHKVLKDLVPSPTLGMLHQLTSSFQGQSKKYVHSEVANHVITLGKQNGWFGVDSLTNGTNVLK